MRIHAHIKVASDKRSSTAPQTSNAVRRAPTSLPPSWSSQRAKSRTHARTRTAGPASLRSPSSLPASERALLPTSSPRPRTTTARRTTTAGPGRADQVIWQPATRLQRCVCAVTKRRGSRQGGDGDPPTHRGGRAYDADAGRGPMNERIGLVWALASGATKQSRARVLGNCCCGEGEAHARRDVSLARLPRPCACAAPSEVSSVEPAVRWPDTSLSFFFLVHSSSVRPNLLALSGLFCTCVSQLSLYGIGLRMGCFC